MKTFLKVTTFTSILVLLIGVGTFIYLKHERTNKVTKQEVLASDVIEEPREEIVYDGMTLTELSDKLNRTLHSTLSGYGNLFASYSLEKGVDPYLAVAIVMHETGCMWECSGLLKYCNNVGGQKGKPSCGGGEYMSYPTLEDGIKGYINNLYNGYISRGLLTPEQIGPRYAASTSWASKVNWYINYIKAN